MSVRAVPSLGVPSLGEGSAGSPVPRSTGAATATSRALRTALAVATVAATVACLLAAAPGAQAYYGDGAFLASASYARLEQADDATQYAAVSANGRYAVIQTRARNLFADDDPDPPGRYRAGGVFRIDLETRALDLVAGGDQRDEATNDLLLRGAQNPSVSADGRYVAFSTAERLVPADTNDNIDVYVRDMAVAAGAPGAFDLVSARDGGSAPAAYAPRPDPLPGRNPGADVTRGAALSADGQRVAFRTQEASDLPAGPATDTPAFQVLLRDRAARTTTLVTRVAATGAPAGGAIGGAAVSADGSTVAWSGQNAPLQTRFQLGEFEDDQILFYLWRRVADGPAAPTRRVTGPVDLDDPACSPSTFVLQNPEATGPCYGPLTDNEAARGQIINTPPALSADGRTVAVLTAAGQRPTIAPGAWTDLFVTDMSPGVSRKAGTLELTREGDPGDSSVSAPIEAVAISADGRTIAITTNRISFVLPTLRPIGPRRTFPSVRDLFVIDLPTRTIERALRSIDGGDANGDVDRAVSVSADGGRVAFVATASNLVVGDANERPDAFVTTRQLEPGQEPPRPPPPAGPGVVEELPPPEPAPRRLSVSAARRADGSVSLRVAVPGPGRLAAAARASRRVKGRTRTSTVARASAKPRRAGRLTMTLRPSATVRARLRRGERVRATATVRYVPARGRAVSRTVRVTFALARGTRQGR